MALKKASTKNDGITWHPLLSTFFLCPTLGTPFENTFILVRTKWAGSGEGEYIFGDFKKLEDLGATLDETATWPPVANIFGEANKPFRVTKRSEAVSPGEYVRALIGALAQYDYDEEGMTDHR